MKMKQPKPVILEELAAKIKYIDLAKLLESPRLREPERQAAEELARCKYENYQQR